jgi:hypothetical protein
VGAALAGVLAFALPGLAQQRHHDEGRGEPQRGAGPYAPPGGRRAGPYGYAYPAPAYGPYAGQPYPGGAYPGGAYPSQAYPGAPPVRRPNSLGAGWREQQEEARFGVGRGRFAPLGQVIEGIQRRMPGRQLDSGIEYEGGRAIYRVRWITVHGRRIDFLVDAATGAILGQR